MLRMYLFEAAGVLLTRVPKWSAQKAWGRISPSAMGSARQRSPLRASFAVILHRMWISETEFNWSKKEATAS